MTQFGKYLLLDRLAVGGMAEVFLAKSFGIEGFEKIIAVKRILPTMAEDEDFIKMFIDEAKIAGHLNHANIVPIYELGKIGESHYIAMEYVWGKDLLQIMNRFRKMRKRMPAPMVAFIAAKMCEALEYAHSKRDRSGKPLNLIHRDISPQNVLVSYEGAVKLIDFGIAKAASRRTTTQAGVLKGKFGYMSPEQVRGLPIDARSDLFAVGTCMYEMLTADRLFVGESDFSTLEKVRHASVRPPSEIVNDCPKEFEEIVMKALALNVDERWSSAGDLHEALQRFLVNSRPTFTASKLAAWMVSGFDAEVRKEKSRLDAFAAVKKASTGQTMRPPGLDRSPVPPVEDEFEGEATAITTSLFEEVDANDIVELEPPAELEEEPTQIFFTSDAFDELEKKAAGPAASVPSGGFAGPQAQPSGPHPAQAGPSGPHPAQAGPSGPHPAQPGFAGPIPGHTGQIPGHVGQGHPGLIQGPTGLIQSQTGQMPIAGGFAPPGYVPANLQEEQKKGRLIIGAIVALLLLGGLLAFFLWPRSASVAITVSPADAVAQISLNGLVRGTAPQTIEGLEEGEYAVRVEAAGFEVREVSIFLEGGKPMMLPLTLEPDSEATAEPGASNLGNSDAVETEAETPTESEGEPETETRTEPEPEAEPEPDSAVAEAEAAAREAERLERQRAREAAERASMREASSAEMSSITRDTQMRQTMRIARTSGAQGTIVINTIPWATVFIDGRDTGRNTPVRGMPIAAGDHVIGLRTQDGTMHRVRVTVPEGETVRVIRRLNEE